MRASVEKQTISNSLPFEQCQLLTPTTPGSENRTFLHHYHHCASNHPLSDKRLRKRDLTETLRTLLWVTNIPYGIIFVSLIEITFHVILTKDWVTRLRFDPLRQHEVWRFVTYMLVHDNWSHLLLNIVFQILYAVNLQVENWKILLIYTASGVGAALGAASIKPDLLIGASGGVYALLISYISLFSLNPNLKYGYWRLTGVVVIILGDGCYNAYHNLVQETPTISWGAHLFGALIGLTLGFLLFKGANTETDVCCRSLRVFMSFSFLIVITSVLIVVDVININARSRGPKVTNQIYRIK